MVADDSGENPTNAQEMGYISAVENKFLVLCQKELLTNYLYDFSVVVIIVNLL